MKAYPTWICDHCGMKYGKWYLTDTYTGPSAHCATYHQGKCDICKESDIPVTEPRDFGHLLDWDVICKRINSENSSSKKHRKNRKENTS